MDKVTIMVIDEQELFRAGVRQVLSQYDGFEVLDCAPSEDTLRQIESAMGSNLASVSLAISQTQES